MRTAGSRGDLHAQLEWIQENRVLSGALGWDDNKEEAAGTLMLGCEEGRKNAG